MAAWGVFQISLLHQIKVTIACFIQLVWSMFSKFSDMNSCIVGRTADTVNIYLFHSNRDLQH